MSRLSLWCTCTVEFFSPENLATRTSKYDVCNLHFPNLKVDELFFLTKSRTNDMMITVRVAAEITMTGRSQFFVPPADLNKKV